MTGNGNSAHIGACFSIVDILSVLYAKVLTFDPLSPKLRKRDRFILSKGHAGAAVYAVLAEAGFFSTEKLKLHYQDGSDFSGHVSHKGVPGVEISTGSLGHGLSIAAGMAYSAKLDSGKHKVFVLLSDGELDEGTNWEAIMFAAHHKLDNLVAIVDYNKIQSLGLVSETLGLEPLVNKWQSFGWEVLETDGHEHDELTNTLSKAKTLNGKPVCVIAHTVKGKGVSFMEHTVLWHYRSAQGEEFEMALKELEAG
jgi:transketolase